MKKKDVAESFCSHKCVCVCVCVVLIAASVTFVVVVVFFSFICNEAVRRQVSANSSQRTSTYMYVSIRIWLNFCYWPIIWCACLFSSRFIMIIAQCLFVCGFCFFLSFSFFNALSLSHSLVNFVYPPICMQLHREKDKNKTTFQAGQTDFIQQSVRVGCLN